MAFLTEKQLTEVGLAKFGKNVLISDKASIYNAKNISIGNNVRIDDFCVLSAGEGGIEVGNFIHIAAFCSIIGQGKITFNDFSGLSSRVNIYSSSDDYSGKFMTNPMVPSEFTNVTHAPVKIGKHVIIGSGSVVLPGVVLEEGVAVGALSLVTKKCSAFGIYVGNPAKRIKERKKELLVFEQQLIDAMLDKNT